MSSNDRPPHILTMPLRQSRPPLARLVDAVDAERRIHLADLALAMSGGREQATRAAMSGNDLDLALSELLDRLRAEGLA